MTTAAAKPTRWALLIGINRYPNFPEHAQLAGCVNDVEAMAGLLIHRFDFPAGNVERLLDGAATQAGIRAALGGLVERVGGNDVVVIHYSGHGSRMDDPAAPDRKDETIVPSDSGRPPHDNLDIRDVEIHQWLQRLTDRTSHLTLIFDSCHSGHILRDTFGAKGRSVEPGPPPAGEAQAAGAGAGRGSLRDGDGGGNDGDGFRLPIGRKYVMVAGCRSNETSFEVLAQEEGGVQHGALTYYLCQELAKAGAASTFRDVYEVVAPQVTGRYPVQHPQLEGARDLQVFGISELEPMRFVPVRKDGAGDVRLGAGAACGMTVGSAWRIYPPGTKSLACGARPLGRLEVSRVRAFDSEARMLEGEIGTAGGRAVEETHRYGETRFGVELDAGMARLAEAAAALEKGIASSPLLRREQGGGSAAAARVYLLPPRTGARDGDPVPAAGALGADSWAVVGADGELLMPVHAAAEAGVVGLLLENLEKRARYRAAMELADPAGELAGRVHLAILGRQGDGWVERGVDDQGASQGEASFRVGESIAFKITHTHPSPLYFYLLDFGLSGAISLIYPAAGGEHKGADRDRATLVGTDRGEEITLRLPPRFPYGGTAAQRQAGWLETVKLFATTREADFSPLVQKTVRSAEPEPPPPASESPLSRLLRTSLSGHGTREMEVARPMADGDWALVQRSFRLLP